MKVAWVDEESYIPRCGYSGSCGRSRRDLGNPGMDIDCSPTLDNLDLEPVDLDVCSSPGCIGDVLHTGYPMCIVLAVSEGPVEVDVAKDVATKVICVFSTYIRNKR